MEPFTVAHRHGGAAAPQQRRHRPDHPGRLPQAGHPHRLRGRAVRRLAQRSRLRPEPAGVRRARRSWSPARTSAPARPGSTRSGRLQDYGFRVVISLAVRRHLPRQRRQGRAADGPGRRSRTSSGCGSSLEAEPGHRGDRRPRRADRVVGRSDVGALRDRRLHPLAADGGPRRRRPDPAARRRRWPLSRPAGRPGCRRRSDRTALRPARSRAGELRLRHNGKRGRRCLSLAVHAPSVAPESSDRSTSASARGYT